MGNVLISIFLLELFFTMLLVINRTVDELLPIGDIKRGSKIKTILGKYILLLQLYLLFLQQLCIYRFFHYILSNIYLYTWN